MSFLPTVLSATGDVLGAVGQVSSANEQYKAAQYNADVALEQARLTREGASLQEYRSRKALRTATSTQEALYAKAGVAFTGSPITAMVDSVANAELDIAIDKFNSEVEARGYESEANQRMYLAKQDKKLAMSKAGMSLLRSSIDVGSKFMVTKAKTDTSKTKIGS